MFCFKNIYVYYFPCTILIIDSGMGGITIYKEVQKLLPHINYLYVFDNESFPYGEKSEKFIVNRIKTIINRIIKKYNFDLIILACNTASILSLSELRKNFSFPIIGVVPAIKPAAELTNNGVIGLLATHVTIRQNYIYQLVKKFAANCQLVVLGSTKLVNIAEEKIHGKIVSMSQLYEILKPWLTMKKPPDTIVLGCTHFSLLFEELTNIFPIYTKLIDSRTAIARRAEWLINKHFVKNLNIKKQKKEQRINRAYYFFLTKKINILRPIFLQLGFQSLEKIE